jgi:hypothetical protein
MEAETNNYKEFHLNTPIPIDRIENIFTYENFVEYKNKIED